MAINGISHGTFVPQGWKLEYSGVDAATAWARSVELAGEAEQLGYDHLWVYDHVETVPRREPTHVFEAFTMLAALSQRTSSIELGQLVTCVGYRNVGLLAKEAACIDVYSGGRFVLGLGAGWYDREYRAYGYEYPANRDRLAWLDEALTVIPRLWSEETVSFEGTHMSFDGAYCDPKPLRSPRPPILVGGGGEQVTLRIAARHADLTNWQVGLEAFVRKSELLARLLPRHRTRSGEHRSHPRPRLPHLRQRGRPGRDGWTPPVAGSSRAGHRTTNTSQTTSWARSSR